MYEIYIYIICTCIVFGLKKLHIIAVYAQSSHLLFLAFVTTVAASFSEAINCLIP